MKIEVEKIFVELIKKQLNLPDNWGLDPDGNEIPCVHIKSQNIKLYNTKELQIAVSTLTNRIYSNRIEHREEIKNDETIYYEDIYVNENRTMQIDMYSKNNDARLRYPEIQAALVSTLAEQLQDKYQFKIGTISDAVNLSGMDGGSDINRYTIRFNCLTWNKYSKVLTADYYDTFRTQAIDTNTDMFADFTIHDNKIVEN